jgi:hypothetical protein
MDSDGLNRDELYYDPNRVQGTYPGIKLGDWVTTFTRWNLRPLDQMQALKTRLVTALPALQGLNTTFMFQPACLLCGKGLTDPVSMARWIGPECAHHCGVRITLDVRQFNLS